MLLCSEKDKIVNGLHFHLWNFRKLIFFPGWCWPCWDINRMTLSETDRSVTRNIWCGYEAVSGWDSPGLDLFKDKSPSAFLKMTYPNILVPKFSWHKQLFRHVWHLETLFDTIWWTWRLNPKKRLILIEIFRGEIWKAFVQSKISLKLSPATI